MAGITHENKGYGKLGSGYGGNIAAVVSQLARDNNGPALDGQLLICPVTDCDYSRASYKDIEID